MKSKSPISRFLTIENRYVRSINIQRDQSDPNALNGMTFTGALAQCLARLFSGLRAGSTQRAWRITGAYGSGKSILGLFLRNLFNEGVDARKPLSRRLKSELPDLFSAAQSVPKAFPVVAAGDGQSLPTALVAALAENVESFGMDAKVASKIVDHASADGEVSPAKAIEIIKLVAASLPENSGLLIIIDEFGRFVEVDVGFRGLAGFYQALSELCGGKSDNPISLVALAHQRLQDYLLERDSEVAVEWARIGQRFEEIVLQPSAEDAAHILTKAIEYAPDVAHLSGEMQRAIASEVNESAACAYPVHPVVARVSGEVFRRFGQGERSLFSFLQSSESFGLQEFINQYKPPTWYRLDRFSDYLIANEVIQSRDQELVDQWGLLKRRLISLNDAPAIEIAVVKTVAALDLVSTSSQISATDRWICLSLADTASDPECLEAIASLIDRDVLFRRPSDGHLVLWPDSGINVQELYRKARKSIGRKPDLSEFESDFPDLRPIMANRHYHKSGTPRSMLRLLGSDLDQLISRANSMVDEGNVDGILIQHCVLRTQKSASDLKSISASLDPRIVISPRPLGTELIEDLVRVKVWNDIREKTQALRTDSAAAAAVDQCIATASRSLETQLEKGLERIAVFYSGKVRNIDASEVVSWVSEFFDNLYSSNFRVHNELLNRFTLSSAAAAARKRLANALNEHNDEESLSIEKTPPEMSMYLSMFLQTGLHVRKRGKWQLATAPGDSNDTQIREVWEYIDDAMRQKSDVDVLSVVEGLSRPPFGVRMPVAEILIFAWIVANKQEIALKESGTYVPAIGEAHIARFCRSPKNFSVQSDTNDTNLKGVLERIAKFAPIDVATPLTLPEITRALYEWYIRLPEYTQGTSNVSPATRNVLSALNRAGDPVRLFLHDLPDALDLPSPEAPGFGEKLGASMAEADSAFPALEERIVKTMGTRLGVDKVISSVRHALCERAKRLGGEVDDYQLSSFVFRSKDREKDDNLWLRSLGSLLTKKNVDQWVDTDEVTFRDEFVSTLGRLDRLIHVRGLSQGVENGEKVAGIHIVDYVGREQVYSLVPGSGPPNEILSSLREILSESDSPDHVLAHLLAEYSMSDKRAPAK